MASFAASGGVLVGARSGKIKENVDMGDLATLASIANREPAAPGGWIIHDEFRALPCRF